MPLTKRQKELLRKHQRKLRRKLNEAKYKNIAAGGGSLPEDWTNPLALITGNVPLNIIPQGKGNGKRDGIRIRMQQLDMNYRVDWFDIPEEQALKRNPTVRFLVVNFKSANGTKIPVADDDLMTSAVGDKTLSLYNPDTVGRKYFILHDAFVQCKDRTSRPIRSHTSIEPDLANLGSYDETQGVNGGHSYGVTLNNEDSTIPVWRTTTGALPPHGVGTFRTSDYNVGTRKSTNLNIGRQEADTDPTGWYGQFESSFGHVSIPLHGMETLYQSSTGLFDDIVTNSLQMLAITDQDQSDTVAQITIAARLWYSD